MTNFNERLRGVRKRMGKSQAAFAEMVGVSTGSQGLYERGGAEPTATYFLNLAEMGIDMNFLFASKYETSPAARHVAELQNVLLQMPPAQQAMGFAILSLIQETAATSIATVENVDEIWRAAREFRQFLKLNKAGKSNVEVAIEGRMIDPPA